eukprot:CAMPEP_0119270790 /NCGR_PEP_ID=MMETSP1329-20130426/7637_1 /TAXON_ID=114041 /ORGANISM="Genus nov. species nov., Strain RCC1024" /LENGTH=453 /DNA_ID=CAMNT_0007270821 /DNA_START=278 /DNA_END=1640 /DNA_ORIENTATION=+
MDDDGVILQAAGTTLLAKLCFEKAARLAEVGDTMGSLRDKFGEFYGPEAAAGALTYQLAPGDADELQLVTDDDVKLANRAGAKPLRVTSTAAEKPEEEDERSAFEHAEASLKNVGLDAPAHQVRRLLQVLDYRPRRLVKCGLAPPKSLAYTPDGFDNFEDDDDEEEEPEGPDASFEVVEPLRAVTLAEPAGEKAPAAAGEKAPFVAAADDVAGAGAAQAAEAALAEPEDAVVAALASRGVKLAAPVLHALLRVLRTAPKRFVKLGMVGDVRAARQAYKRGGKASARELFKKGGCKGGYGRGLHGRGPGGRGRGHGWEHAGEGPRKRGKWAGASSGAWGDALAGGHWNSVWGAPSGSHSWGASWHSGTTNKWGAPPPGMEHEPLGEDANAPVAPPPPPYGKGGWGHAPPAPHGWHDNFGKGWHHKGGPGAAAAAAGERASSHARPRLKAAPSFR